jgi:cytochrome c2
MNIDQIDAYLDGTLSPADKIAFETQLAGDESLRQAVEVQKNLRAGIERLGMKAATASTFKKMTLKNKLYKWGAATVAVTAIATSIYYGMNPNSSSNEGVNITYELPATNENGGTDWATADRNLPTQLFEINPDKDTVIETMNGLVFAIPAGAFLNANDPVTLEIREAVTPMDIMKGGLSTTSNGELLETGGMFYINARNGETSLKINPDKPVYANVPTNEIRPGMQLFDGERKPDGSINWVNPKPVEKQLIPVDIFSLNFYPAGFQEKCAELGFDANNKKVTDSIYYSYAGRQISTVAVMPAVLESSSDSARVRHILISYDGAGGGGPVVSRSKEEARRLAYGLRLDIAEKGVRMIDIVEQYTDDPGSKSGNKGDYGWFTHESGFVQPFLDAGFNNEIGDVVVAETDFGFHVIEVLDKTSPTPDMFFSNANAPDGEALFKANCSSCHSTTDRKVTGPGLRGVLGRIPGGNWRYDWVHNASALIQSGDPYANKIFNEYKSVQTNFPKLTNQEIDAILFYADNGGHPPHLEIDPARIAAIQTAEFQNTLIATKEFEERLQVIFEIGNPEILDLYVRNMDRKMYELDSAAATMTEGNQFHEFYLRHDGGVAISQSHMKELQEYYQKKQEAVRIANEKTYNARTGEQRKQDSAYFAGRQQQITKNATQSAESFNTEYNINLKEAYRQLGIPQYTPPPPADYYSFEVTTPGWKNVDAYVAEATVNRATLDYTDPSSGKKAVIKYEELKVNIANASNYTQLMVYLVADSLPCFMKLYPVDNGYSEKLNELMEYSLVVMGQKDGTWFSAITPKVTPGSVNVTLLSTDESSLRNTLNSTFSGKVGADFSAEVNYMKETHQFNVRKEKERKQLAIDEQIMRVIFPFFSTVGIYDQAFGEKAVFGGN